MIVYVPDNLLTGIEKYQDNSKVYKAIIQKRTYSKNGNSLKPYISIIIPCYNVEEYIDRCMKTVTSQTIGIDKLQVIAVNDASTDNTLDKLINWEKKYPENIIVISYNKNLRQGGARNIGLCYADAEYIGFVDSDDWIELNMYEILYNIISDKKLDTVKCKCIYDFATPEKFNLVDFIPSEAPAEESLILYDFEKINGFYKEEIHDYGKEGRWGGVWSGIYLKERILKNNIWFPEKLIYEDNFWGSVLSLYIKNTCIADKVLYHYFQRGNSAVHVRNDKSHFDRLSIEILIIEEYKKRGIFDVFHDYLEHRFIQMFYLNTLYTIFTKFDYIPDIFNFLKEKVFFFFPDIINEIDVSCYNELDQKLIKLLFVQGYVYPEMLIEIKNIFLQIVAAHIVNNENIQ